MNKTTRPGCRLTTLFGLVALLNSRVEGAVTLLNPGFEDSATWQTSGWLQTVEYYPGAPWTPQIIDDSHSFFGDTPFGQRYALMEAPDIGNAVLQYVTGFELGQNYELRFWAAAGFSDSFVQIGGLIGVQDDSMPHYFLYELPVTSSFGSEFSNWYEFSIRFTAPSETMTLYIGQSGQGFGPVYFPPIAVDQISITAVPEPRAAGTAAVVLLFAVRRRRESFSKSPHHANSAKTQP